MERHGIYSMREFFPMLEERSGRRAAAVACTVCLWFFLAHTAVFARLWAELLRVYLASGALTTVLGVLPILGGILYLRKMQGSGTFVRVGRTLEITFSALSAVLVWFLGDGIPLGWLRDGAAYAERFGVLFPGIAPGRWEIVPALSLLIVFLFAAAWGMRCVRASYEYLYPLCVDFYRGRITETAKLYGTEFAEELSAWSDGQKAKFFGIKMTKSLAGLPYAGKISRYGERITAKLTAVRIWWWVAVLMVYALTVGFADAFSAVSFYRAYNLEILVPATLILSAVMTVIVRRKGAAGYADKKLLQWRK